MNGMDEWQRMQNEKIALMGTIEGLVSKLMNDNKLMREALEEIVACFGGSGSARGIAAEVLRAVGQHHAHDRTRREVMTPAREIYTRAEMAARKEHARLVRLFTRGKIDVCPGGMDMERDAIIAAFDEALGSG